MNPVRLATLRRQLVAAVLGASALVSLAANPKASQFYEDALQRFEKKDFAGAIIQLKNSIKIDNKQLPVQMLLGKALLANGEVAAAEVAFNEALKLGVNRAEVVVPMAQSVVAQARQAEVVATGPRFDTAGLPPTVRQELLLVKAAAHSDLGSPLEGLKAIKEARAIAPEAPDSWLAEVPVQIRARNFKEAATASARALALAPKSAEAHYLRGSVAHAQGSIAGALEEYERALELMPTHLEARVSRMGLYMDQGRLDAVAKEVAEVRRIAPRDPRATYLGALVSERKGDYKASRAALAEITSLLDPIPLPFMRYRPQLLMLGGLAHHGLGQSEKARPYLEAASRLQPNAPVAKLLGQIYLNDKNYDRAIETLEAFVKGNAGDTQAVVLLATAQMSKGRPARAAQLLQEAVKTHDTPQLHAFLGLTLVGGGKLVDALVELEKAYRKDPSQLAAGAALVDLYLKNKQPKRALDVAEALAKRVPKDAQYQALVGYALSYAGETVRARAAFEHALKLDPSFLPAQLDLARLDARERKDADAIRRLNSILAKDDKHIEALMELSLLAERRGQGPEALRVMQKASELNVAGSLGATLALLELHLRAGRPEQAQGVMKLLENKAPDSLAVLMAGARVRLASKDPQGAQPALARASRSADYDPQLLTQIALLQIAAEDVRAALHTLTKALQANPGFLPAKVLAVDANLRLGDLAQAEQIAREFAKQHPKLALSSAMLGDVAAARGQTTAALDAYRRAHQAEPSSDSLARLYRAQERQDPPGALQLAEGWVKAHPSDLPSLRLLAASYARAGKLVSARGVYESLLNQAPDDAEILNNLANVLLLLKDPNALPIAERALARKPGAAHIIGTTGWAAFQAGQVDRALLLLRDARLRDPNNADTRYFLGAVLASKGRNVEARDEIQGALKSGVSLENSKAAQDLLQTLK